MTDKLQLLLYNDGSDVSNHAMALGKHIAQAAAHAVDILLIAAAGDQERVSSQQIEETAGELRASGISVTVYQRAGFTGRRLLEQTEAKDYDLIVVGSRGRRGLTRLLAGSRACAILGSATTSVLVVKGRDLRQINNILICTAAGPASGKTVRFAAQLAHALEASVTLLHVMSQVALEHKAQGPDLEAEAEQLMERQAREGRHLEDMLRVLHEESVEAQALVRHGLVVDEIIAEAKDGDFDMIVTGAHTTPDLPGLLSSDLSQQVMLAANRPILIVHQA